jgi:hypothetical protein
MIDPIEIQIALVGRLKALNTEAGERIYDDVPAEEKRKALTGAAWPYISLGDGGIAPIDETCADRATTKIVINVWSREVGYPQVKRIAAAIGTALDQEDLEIPGQVLDSMEVEDINFMRDPDGKTRRARISLSIDTHPA